MPRIQITNQELFHLRDDINKQSAKSYAFSVFNMTKIDNFFRQNKMPLQLLDASMTRIIKSYAIHDKEGKPVREERDGAHHFTFIDADMENKYRSEVSEFMGRSNYIEV